MKSVRIIVCLMIAFASISLFFNSNDLIWAHIDQTKNHENALLREGCQISSPDNPPLIERNPSRILVALLQSNLIDFEEGIDSAPIKSTIPGVEFITTQGYDWVYGDWRTGLYNGKYPNGSYFSNGNIFAWLGPNQGSGIIDFTNDDGTYARVGISTYSGVYFEAYDTQGNMLDQAYANNNLNTGELTFLEVHAPPGQFFDYLLLHDSGNYWLIDDLTTDASNVGPIPDLAVKSFEINQAVRDSNALVAGRPAIARVGISTGGPNEVSNVRAILEITRNGQVVSQARSRAYLAKDVPSQDDIWAGNNTLNFKFYPIEGTYRFRVILEPAHDEEMLDNNEYIEPDNYVFQITRGPLSGQSSLRLNVYTRGRAGANDRPNAAEASDALEGITRLFPLRQPAIEIASYEEFLFDWPGEHSSFELSALLLEKELEIQIHNFFHPNDRRDNGMLFFSPDIMPGTLAGRALAPGLTFLVSNSPNTYHFTSAHEAGHNYSLQHDPDCVPGQTVGNPVEAGAFDPFSIISADVVPGSGGLSRISYMYGCTATDNRIWTRIPSYEHLFRAFGGNLNQFIPENDQENPMFVMASYEPETYEQHVVFAAAAEDTFLIGTVVIDDETGVSLLPILRMAGPFEETVFSGGPYAVEILSTNGERNVVGEFEMITEEGSGGFQFFLQDPTNLQAVRILHNGIEVAGQETSLAGPSVMLQTPNGGEFIGDSFLITWNAMDADNDSLSYTVLYSPDEGTTWNLLASNLTDIQYLWASRNASGSNSARIRVIASDGLLTAADDSDENFTIPGKGPSIIISPMSGFQIIEFGSEFELVAQAWDTEDGAILEQQIGWSSSLDGALTTGRILNLGMLYPGSHQLTASALDSEGNTAEAFRSIEVIDSEDPVVRLGTPNGREFLCSAESFRIQWDAEDNHRIDHIDIYLSIDGGASYDLVIASGLTNTNCYTWNVPLIAADRCRVRVQVWDPSGNVAEDISNSEFSIVIPINCEDSIKPESIIGLNADCMGECIQLTWYAPGDSTFHATCDSICEPDYEPVANYELRYSITPIISESDFQSAIMIDGLSLPSAPEIPESTLVCDLLIEERYYFAIRSIDSAGNESKFDTTSVLCQCYQPHLSLIGYETVSWNDPLWEVQVEVSNMGPGIAKNVTAYMEENITWLTIPDPYCSYGDIPDGGSSFGDQDSYTFDLSNCNASSFNAWFIVTYEDICGNQYQLRLDPEFNLEDKKNPSIPVNSYRLEQNYPNPFNPVTLINYQIPVSGHVNISIYDISGSLISTLVNKQMEQGIHSVEWNGKDNMGNSVASGIYFYRMQASKFVETRKMILLR